MTKTTKLRCHSPPPDLLRQIAEHKLWLETAGQEGTRFDSGGGDLENLDLDGVDLSLARLAWTNFDGSSLRNAWLVRADLDLARLVGCRLENARFDGARVFATNFRESKYAGATFRNVDTEEAIWTTKDWEASHATPDKEILATRASRQEIQVDEGLEYWRTTKIEPGDPQP